MTELNNEHLINCKILPNRYHILEYIPKNSIGVEIGVLGGDWSKHLLRVTQPKELVLIDTYYSDDYPQAKRFTKKTHEQYIRNEFKPYDKQVKILKGLSWDSMATYNENYFDWIYIDAAHDYQSVKKDLFQAKRTIKETGLIIMNDYIMYDHFTKEKYGVVQATNEFMVENNYEMLFFALHPDMFCDVVIKKRSV
ncbi:MAG: class I SAM-dependent methyltransferase [Bacteroidetes bacterium]|nr:class I SAM-dependent methyltransferase [Bacteroidota bacterium]